MYHVVTGRFNNETCQSNYAYREKRNFACMYSCPTLLSPKIPYNVPVFVIEMNNSTNKILGIGLIKNSHETSKYYKVHSDGNNNRYTYIGKYYMDRDTIDDYNANLVFILEEILFKGKTHSKRGCGLTLFPDKVLKLDVCEGMNVKKEIKELFVYHYREKLQEKQEQEQEQDKQEQDKQEVVCN
jgi:hypothetical protein